MSLAQFWAVLKAARWSIGLMMLVAMGLAFAFAESLPKQYTAKARVMLNIDNPDPTQFSQLKKDTAGAYIGTELRLVADRAVTRDVATRLGWPDNPQVIAAWQAATGGVGDVTDWAASQISTGIYAAPLEDSSIIEIYYASSSLDNAKQMAGLVRTSYMDQSLKLRAEAARRAAAWNRTQAATALADLRKAEAARLQFVTANQIPVDTPVGGLDYAAQATALASTTAGVKPRASAATEDPAIGALKRRLDAIDAEIATAQLRGGDANPALVSLRLTRETTKARLGREQAVAQGGPQADSAQIGLVARQRDADYLAARLRLLDRAPLYDALARLDRDIALKTQRYDAAAQRVVDFETIAAAPSGLRVIGDVIAKDEPSFPNIPLSVGVAAGASFALGVALALVGELARRRVRSVEDMHFYGRVPVLAVIPRLPDRRRRWRWLRLGRPVAA